MRLSSSWSPFITFFHPDQGRLEFSACGVWIQTGVASGRRHWNNRIMKCAPGLGSQAIAAFAWQTYSGVVSDPGLRKGHRWWGELAVARRATYLAVPGPVRLVRPCEDLFLTITNYNAWNSSRVFFFLLYCIVIICIIVCLAFV